MCLISVPSKLDVLVDDVEMNGGDALWNDAGKRFAIVKTFECCSRSPRVFAGKVAYDLHFTLRGD